MAKSEEQLKEEFLFIVENNNELRNKVIASYNDFLEEYRQFFRQRLRNTYNLRGYRVCTGLRNSER